jgi:hypothetical protein
MDLLNGYSCPNWHIVTNFIILIKKLKMVDFKIITSYICTVQVYLRKLFYAPDFREHFILKTK